MGWGLRIDQSTIIIGDFNIPLLITGGITREKINRKIEDLNNITNQLYLTEVYRTLQATTAEYAFFSRLHDHTNIVQTIIIKAVWYWYKKRMIICFTLYY